jgi:hypothetical protein
MFTWHLFLHAIHTVLELQFLFELFALIFSWQWFGLWGDWNEETSRSLWAHVATHYSLGAQS